jgi:hypothetical protein
MARTNVTGVRSYTSERTGGAIKNGQSRNLQHWIHKTQAEDRKKYTTQKTKKISNTTPTKTRG